jgi:hypothetical protein
MTRVADMIAVAITLSSGWFNFEKLLQVVSAYRTGCGTSYKVFVAHVSLQARFAIKT